VNSRAKENMDKMLHLTLFGYVLAAGGVKRTSMNIRGGTSMVTDYESVRSMQDFNELWCEKRPVFSSEEEIRALQQCSLANNKTKMQFTALRRRRCL
jgi:hypothetical protein